MYRLLRMRAIKNCIICLIAGISFFTLVGYSSSSLKVFNAVEGSKVIKIDVKNLICSVNDLDQRSYIRNSLNDNLTTIYYVTPTYPRPEQTPELIRLSHTLMNVPKLHWIVADDQPVCSDEVLRILRKTGLPYTHIASPKPYVYKSNRFPRGVSNRRAAIDWLQDNAKEGILYFGDDDNTVDLQLFDEIRKTKKVSMFPVGLIGEYGVSSPVVKNGKVVGFFDSWPGTRVFPVDMAGFAVNLKFLAKKKPTMPYLEGQEENMFLLGLDIKINEIEPLADNCSKVLVWHTKTLKNKRRNLKVDTEELSANNYEGFAMLIKELHRMEIADSDVSHGQKAYMIRNKKLYDISKLD